MYRHRLSVVLSALAITFAVATTPAGAATAKVTMLNNTAANLSDPVDAVSNDSSVWVLNQGNNSITQLQTGTNAVQRVFTNQRYGFNFAPLASIIGRAPQEMFFDAARNRLWVLGGSNRLIGINLTNGAESITQLSASPGYVASAITGAGLYLWVGFYITGKTTGQRTIDQINANDASFELRVPMGAEPFGGHPDERSIYELWAEQNVNASPVWAQEQWGGASQIVWFTTNGATSGYFSPSNCYYYNFVENANSFSITATCFANSGKVSVDNFSGYTGGNQTVVSPASGWLLTVSTGSLWQTVSPAIPPANTPLDALALTGPLQGQEVTIQGMTASGFDIEVSAGNSAWFIGNGKVVVVTP